MVSRGIVPGPDSAEGEQTHMNFWRDERIILTMDAGGTNFVFTAIAGGIALTDQIRLPANGTDLDLCLETIVKGFTSIRDRVDGQPVAISFAFPGPADYPAGVIGDLANLPAFRGGVPLGPILANHFGLPVFINNDGDLFTYGEAISGLLPSVQQSLQDARTGRHCDNLFGVTLGTGFGAGLVSGKDLYLGNNGAGMEIWSTRAHFSDGYICEDDISARAISRVYSQEAGIALELAPTPKQISDIAEGIAAGNPDAAALAFTTFGAALGESLANVVCLTDSLVVIGGGLSQAHRHFLSTTVETMNGLLDTHSGGPTPRLEVTA